MSSQNPVTGDRSVIVTAADAAYFDLLRGMIVSVLRHRPENSGVDVACYDLGLTQEQLDWLHGQGVKTVVPVTLLEHTITSGLQGKLGYLGRPFLRENFPGYDIYIWLDADTWLQDWSAVTRLAEAAKTVGGVFVRENAPEYRFRMDLFLWKAINFKRGYGNLRGLRLLLKPHINNGVFALRADAPHWEIWRGFYQEALTKTGKFAPFDQFGLNATVYLTNVASTFLPATCNWICDLALPDWDESRGVFCAPSSRHEPISVVHLAGPAKHGEFDVKVVGGGAVRKGLRYSEASVATA